MQQHAPATHHGAPTTAAVGRLGRLGAWAADHYRVIAITWCGVVLVLGGLALRARTTDHGSI